MSSKASGCVQNRNLNEFQKENAMKRLPKRLTYLLRYGALKEGLDVDANGFVRLDDLMTAGLMQDYTPEEVLKEIKTSVSYRSTQRYDWREEGTKCLVRAAYLRNFERNPYHSGTKIPTLYESTMQYIITHLDDYDLEDFYDEEIIRAMIHRLKRQKKLNNKAMKALLVPTITRLDLEGIYLTNNILRMVWTQCPHLTAVSLKDCGYIMTDHILAQFTKNLPQLQRLNLCSCNHLTAKSLSILTKNLLHLKVLHMASVPSLTYEAVLKFLETTKELNFLDVYYLRTKPEQYEHLIKIAGERDIKLVLREPRQRKDKQEEGNVEQMNGDEQDSDGNSSEQNSNDNSADMQEAVNSVSDGSAFGADIWDYEDAWNDGAWDDAADDW